MLQFCFWLSLSNHPPDNQVVHLQPTPPPAANFCQLFAPF